LSYRLIINYIECSATEKKKIITDSNFEQSENLKKKERIKKGEDHIYYHRKE